MLFVETKNPPELQEGLKIVKYFSAIILLQHQDQFLLQPLCVI